LVFPPYNPHVAGDDLQDKTLCPNLEQKAGFHYDVHNMYGWFQSEPTLRGVIKQLITAITDS